MTTPINFPTAKLLKEKGFDEWCRLCIGNDDEIPLPFNCGNNLHRNSLHPYYSAPTIVEVVMWLYKTYGIWISCDATINLWYYSISTPKTGKMIISTSEESFNSPQEAYEAGIEYVLKNLI